MNKRYYQNDATVISRLADQAHAKSVAIYEQRTKTERADQVIFYDIFNYEFAQLIVRECLKQIYGRTKIAPGDYSWPEKDVGYNEGINAAYKQIKQHFGIEE